MAATIKDIARETSLAQSTVSAYLNGVNVRDKNKKLIENAIKKLDYVRNDYARGLKMHRSLTIGVLIPELSNIFSTTIISEMEDVLRKKGYGIIVCDCRSDKAIEKESIEFLMSKMVDGLIVMPINTDKDLFSLPIDRNVPVVVIDRLTESQDVSYIVINNKEISKCATENLIKNGHRNIALITGAKDVYTARERYKGYKIALDSVKSFNINYVYDGKLSTEGGYKAMKEIIHKHPEVTALFVTNYEMSIGAIIAINESGKKIPEDYSFVGFEIGRAHV